VTRPSLADFLETSCGTYEISVVTRKNIRAQNPKVIRTIADWAWQAKQPPGKLCMCCESEFYAKGGVQPHAFSVLEPFIPSTKVVVSGMCKSCFLSGDLRVKLVLAWRKVLPDFSEIEGGRA
jgi:hypothetical protein